MAIKLRHIIAHSAAAFLILSSTPAFSAWMYFGDRASFEAASAVTLREDFESFAGQAGSFLSSSVATPSGIGVETNSFISNDLYVAGPGQSTNPTTALGVDHPIGNTLWLNLGGYYSAFGVDVFQNFGSGSQGTAGQSVIYEAWLWSSNASDYVGSFWSSVLPNQTGFVGFTADTPFDWVEIYAHTGGYRESTGNTYEVIDNIAVGTANSVPLPGTLPLISIGLAGFAVLRRRMQLIGCGGKRTASIV